MSYSYIIGVFSNLSLSLSAWAFVIVLILILTCGMFYYIENAVDQRKKFRVYFIIAILALLIEGVVGAFVTGILGFLVYAFAKDFNDYK